MRRRDGILQTTLHTKADSLCRASGHLAIVRDIP